MNGEKLANQHVLISGGAGGIGLAVVEQLLGIGAKVSVLDLDCSSLAEKDWHHNKLLNYHNCDLTKDLEIAEVLGKLIAETEPVKYLVNCAGAILNEPLVSIGPGGLKKHSVESWDRNLAVNLSSAFYLTSRVVQIMLSNRIPGVVVNISSVCSAGNAGQSAYSAAKAGLDALTVTWAKELASWSIRVVGIAPGFTDTEAVAKAMGTSALGDVKKKIPMRRMASPQEIAEAVIFALSNSYFNGRTLCVDGGLRL